MDVNDALGGRPVLSAAQGAVVGGVEPRVEDAPELQAALNELAQARANLRDACRALQECRDRYYGNDSENDCVAVLDQRQDAALAVRREAEQVGGLAGDMRVFADWFSKTIA